MASTTLDPATYGYGFSGLTDLLAIDSIITDPAKLIGQRLAHRLTTPRGALAIINGPADFGWDVHQLVNQKLGPSSIAAAQNQIQAECLKDEQVQSASVTITQAGAKLTIKIRVVSAAGPFNLTFNISERGAAQASQAIFSQ